MAGFIYFLGGRAGYLAEGEIPSAVAHAFERGDPIEQLQIVDRGPGGGAGLLIARAGSLGGKRLAYQPDAQTWVKLPGWKEHGAQVGYWPDDPPTPEQLARPWQLPGYSRELGDGREWLVPVIRKMADGEEMNFGLTLPATTGYDEETGEWVRGAVEDRYAPLIEVSGKVAEVVYGAWKTAEPREEDDGVTMTLDFTGERDAALTLLAANYRLGKAEVGLLGLFTDSALVQVMICAVDQPAVQQAVELLAKKNTA